MLAKSEQHLVFVVNGCIEGKLGSQKQLFDLFHQKLFAVALRYTKNAQDAEDVLQETFIRIFDKISTFNFEGSFEGWTKRICINIALRFIEQRKRSVCDDINAVAGLFVQPSEGDSDLAYLLKLIDGLPKGYQAVFNMYVIDGLSHAEIADILGISEGTSKSQLARARKHLQDLIIENDKQKQAI